MLPLVTEVKDRIGYVLFNRPEKHNALNSEMLVRLADCWNDWARRDDVQVVIVTGSGERAFCVGGDLETAIPALTGDRKPDGPWDLRYATEEGLQDHATLRHPFPKPIIAAVNGMCMAGGFEFLLGTDIRVAAEHATFGLPEAKIGLIPAAGSLARLPRQIPFAKALELMLTGGTIDAAEALRLGLINHVVNASEVLVRAEAVAAQILMNAPLAVQAIKETAIACSGRLLQAAFEIENAAFDAILKTEDAREGARAFIAKRRPRFAGR